MKYKYTDEDYAFMNSLSSAVAEQTPKRTRLVIYFWFFTVLIFIVWASFTQIDEITRGSGEVVPSGKNQMVQNLEGGIVEDIFVHIGDEVKKGDPLLKIDNRKSQAQRKATQIKAIELKAKMIRLQAEAKGEDFRINLDLEKLNPELVENERILYLSRQRQYKASMRVLKEQKVQKQSEHSEMKERIKYFQKSAKLIGQEVSMTAPMVKQGVKSRVSFIKLQREENTIKKELRSLELNIPRVEAGISELDNKILEAEEDFRNKAKKELNEVTAEAMRVKASFDALDNQMQRTLVRSPLRGIIQTLFVNTIGGVIKAGEDLVEIVPEDEASLLIEVKIKPADIAFIYPKQKAIVKVSAYDFAIYGSLEGKIVHISANTDKDKKGNVFYTVHIKTNKDYLGTDKKPLKIIPGMTVNVDIMTGKKSLMDYILKPILKAKQYTFTER